jgi:hypothetical protein
VKVYSTDFNEFLPPNEDDGGAPPGHSWIRGNAHYGQGAQATNITYITEPTNNVLAKYAPGPKLYKCPADPAKALIGAQRIPTIRSFSLNQAVGTSCAGFAAGGGHTFNGSVTAVTGPWLTGNHRGNRPGQPFRTYGKDSDFHNAAMTFTFVDEHHESINDAGFGHPGMPGPGATVNIRWVDYPAAYHNGAGGFSFGDGHSEIKKWRGLKYRGTTLPGAVTPALRPDWDWLAERSSPRQ